MLVLIVLVLVDLCFLHLLRRMSEGWRLKLLVLEWFILAVNLTHFHQRFNFSALWGIIGMLAILITIGLLERDQAGRYLNFEDKPPTRAKIKIRCARKYVRNTSILFAAKLLLLVLINVICMF